MHKMFIASKSSQRHLCGTFLRNLPTVGSAGTVKHWRYAPRCHALLRTHSKDCDFQKFFSPSAKPICENLRFGTPPMLDRCVLLKKSTLIITGFMSNSMLFNQIKLAFPPISANMFSKLRKLKDFKETLEHSQLYIICQRKELHFKNFDYREDIPGVTFEISNPDINFPIKCYLPFFQEKLAKDPRKNIGLAFEATKKNNPSFNYKEDKVSIVNIIEQKGNEKPTVLFRMSPEVFIYNYVRENLKAEVNGELEGFLRYKVHYVGKATEQNICERLTGHSTFQDILSLENPMHFEDIPSNEITLLLFEVEDNYIMLIDDLKDEKNVIAEILRSYELPSYKELSLDAEKLLIRAMNPKYNQVKFVSYPTKSDLLNTSIHDYIGYRLFDPITLIYEDGEVRGKLDYEQSDTIYVKK